MIDLGITAAHEIDVEVIARAVGVDIRYRVLANCDARILGKKDRAIICVDGRASPQRQRFSIAHELGHWHLHRGRRLACQSARLSPHQSDASVCIGDPEHEADMYAANLLMPDFLLDAEIERSGPISPTLVRHIAALFDVSTVAAALRLVSRHPSMCAMMVEEPDGRCWFKRSPSLPPDWFLRMDRKQRAAALPSSETMSYTLAFQWFVGTPKRWIQVGSIGLISGATIVLLALPPSR